MTAMVTPMARAAPIGASAPGAAYSPAWFVHRQIANAERYLAGLAPFREDEFGSSANPPSPAHIRAAQDIGQMRKVSDVRNWPTCRNARSKTFRLDVEIGLELRTARICAGGGLRNCKHHARQYPTAARAMHFRSKNTDKCCWPVWRGTGFQMLDKMLSAT
ncbi:hypothetical protein Q5Y75_14620 [Ruegeria sp. 2205SS24-7]|uniref:hypothetical protein n=1 Tax=Ruegeria discodermiae TaxID=3064389 RepID=UPI002742705F|nr:hypothetical protein [Ruegeria sp. 2205SS24-7]MDP5218462.1 hypothetical protein [Ruegeria sp. 2205SS24-7]